MADFIRIQPNFHGDITVPRSFDDYDVAIDESGLPPAVTLIRKC